MQGCLGNHDYYVCSERSGVDIILEEPDIVDHPVWAGIRHAREQRDATAAAS